MSTPTTARTIPFARPWVTDDDRHAVLAVLQGDVLTHGPQSKAFEQEFAEFIGPGAHCLSMSSGMAALHLAYWQLGIRAGDEVIVPAQTHIATVHAVEAVGATPVFADCLPDTGNIDPEAIRRAVSSRTRAIGIVHFLGIPCDMDAVMAIASEHDLRVVEDCALAVGTRYRGRHVGLFGDAACFSFYPVKHITTGDGGMFLTRHADLSERVAKARAFGVDRSFAERTIPGMYDVPTLGLNYRLSDINAALGRGQLRRIGEILTRRLANFRALATGLAGLRHLSVIDANTPDATSGHYCLSFVLDGALSSRRNEVVARLNEVGIGTSLYYPQPVPRMKYYAERYGYTAGAYPQAARISDQSIALPVGPHLTPDDAAFIADTVHRIVMEMQES